MISCKIWVAVKLASFNKVKPFNFTFWKLLEHSAVILIRVCALSSCRNLQLFVYNQTTTTANNDWNSSLVQKSSNFCPTITIEAVAKTNNFQMIGFFFFVVLTKVHKQHVRKNCAITFVQNRALTIARTLKTWRV